MSVMADRFFLSQDNDCHWYVIPVARQQEWYKWLNSSDDYAASLEAPEFVVPLGGSPSSVSFIDPVFS